MPEVCWYFQLHQPYRLAEYSVFDLDSNRSYFVEEKRDESTVSSDSNRAIFQKVAQKSYLPMLRLLQQKLADEPTFTFTLSASGVFLEQALTYQPEVIALLQAVTATRRVEWLAETYYHSLASLYSPTEFRAQVSAHTQLLKTMFEVSPTIFRNTELIYSDAVSDAVVAMGFKGMLTEAVDRYLEGHQRTLPMANYSGQLPLLLKHAQLSDDIAFRFSEKSWQWYPLTVERYLEWLHAYSDEHGVNLFMDFETFGEHQWESTGVFDFFAELIRRGSHDPHITWVTPSQKCQSLDPAQLSRYQVPTPISWADVDRDLTAWTENAFQQDTLRLMYELEAAVLTSNQPELVTDWRRLQTSDHFYYMCTKWAADGDVHAYFSPYSSPFEAYRRFSTVLADIRHRLFGTLD